jgi:hypothetical protein
VRSYVNFPCDGRFLRVELGLAGVDPDRRADQLHPVCRPGRRQGAQRRLQCLKYGIRLADEHADVHPHADAHDNADLWITGTLVEPYRSTCCQEQGGSIGLTAGGRVHSQPEFAKDPGPVHLYSC